MPVLIAILMPIASQYSFTSSAVSTLPEKVVVGSISSDSVLPLDSTRNPSPSRSVRPSSSSIWLAWSGSYSMYASA